MKQLVIYDSLYGNTAAIAEAIAAALGEAESSSVDQVDAGSLRGVELLVLGSPTQGGRPTPKAKAFLAGLAPHALTGVKVAAFDTRLTFEGKGTFLKLLMRLVGYAAPRLAKGLQAKGGQQVAVPEGFIVTGREGPLQDGELERAKGWAKGILSAMPQPIR